MVLADNSFSTAEAIAAVAFFFFIAAVLIGLIIGLVELRKAKLKAGQEDALRQLVGRYEQLAENTLDAATRSGGRVRAPLARQLHRAGPPHGRMSTVFGP